MSLSKRAAAFSLVALTGCSSIQYPQAPVQSDIRVLNSRDNNNHVMVTYPTNNKAEPIGNILVSRVFERNANGAIRVDAVWLARNGGDQNVIQAPYAGKQSKILPVSQGYYACSSFRVGDGRYSFNSQEPKHSLPQFAMDSATRLRENLSRELFSQVSNGDIQFKVADEGVKAVVAFCNRPDFNYSK